MAQHESNPAYIGALKWLEEFFSLPIPRSTPLFIIRQFFSVSAKVMAEKVLSSPEAIANLKIIGAQIPESHFISAETYACFGILHDAKVKACQVCKRRELCAASNNNANSRGADSMLISTATL